MARNSFDNMGSSFASFGATVAKVSLAAVLAIGLITAATGALAIKMGEKAVTEALSLEDAFTGVLKTTKSLGTGFFDLSEQGEEVLQGFRDLAKETPIAVEELMRIGELGGQLGIAEDDLLNFTEIISQLSVTTDLSVDSAALALARFANVMQTSGDDFRAVGDVIVALGNNTATTESEITRFGERIAASGAIAGLAEADVLAIGAALSSVGVRAERGGTAVQKSLLSMVQAVAEGGEDLEIFAEITGKTAEGFAELFRDDAGQAFEEFILGLGKDTEKAIGFLDDLGLGNERTKQSMLSLAGAGPLITETMDLANQAWEDNNALQTEANLRFGTTSSQMEIFKNIVRDLWQEIGIQLLPIVQDVIKELKPWIDQLSKDLPEAFNRHILPALEKFVPWLKDFIPQAITTLTNVWNNLLKPAFQWFMDNKEVIIGAFVALGAVLASAVIVSGILAIAAAINPVGIVIGLIVGAITLLGAAWAGNWGGIRDFFDAVWENQLKPAFETMKEILQVVIPAALQFLTDVWNNVLFPAVKVVIGWFRDVVFPILGGIADVITAVLSVALTVMAGIWQNILQPAIKGVVDFLEAHLMPIFETVSEFVGDTLGPILEWLNENIIQPLITGVGGIVDAVKSLVDWLGDLADTIRSIKLPSWMTPGSPTPLEMGIRGITAAMGDLSNMALPAFRAELDFAGRGGGVSRRTEEVHNHWELRTVLPDVGDIPLRDWIRIQRTLNASAA